MATSTYTTLDFPILPNPFAIEPEQISMDNSFTINDAPPRVFFPPKISLKKDLEYKKKRPILDHISTSFNAPHKLALKPTTSHPLNHQITTSPVTPTFLKKFHNNNELFHGIRKQLSLSKVDATGNGILRQNTYSNKEKIKIALKKQKSMPGVTGVSSTDTDLKNDLLKDDNDNNCEKKMVIVHEVKPSDTIAGVSLLYGIEISILKKANKLWTNDSIHLRKYLYIPIDQCSIIDDEAKVVVQDDHISIKANRSDCTIRPSFSTSSPSTPFTIYERELLFCTLPEHANYNNHDHNLHSRHVSDASTASSMWSIASSSSSISSTTSNNSNTNNYTRAEIQQLPADQLTFFPPKRSTSSANSSAISSTPLTTPALPSPSPVSHLNRQKQQRSISFPLPAMTQDSTQNLNNTDEKYWKKRGRNDIFADSHIDSQLLFSLNKVGSRKLSS